MKDSIRYVLVTGVNGMIGRRVAKELLDAKYNVLGISVEERSNIEDHCFVYKQLDLCNCWDVEKIFNEYPISHVIHLAAIAHTKNQADLSWSRYYRINTLCAKTIFIEANKKNIPVLFSSTVDVFGICNETVTNETEPNPIGYYAKSKFLAEKELHKICTNSKYTIVRFAPVYKKDDCRDIYKRFYIKEGKLCYKIGKGLSYEFLDLEKIAPFMLAWVNGVEKTEQIINLCDKEPHAVTKMINDEKKKNPKLITVHIPGWVADSGYFCVLKVFGSQSMIVFTISKVVKPIKIKRMA